MRRVDRRTNALQTDRPTDTASYRGALSHLKRKAVTWRTPPAPLEHFSGLSLALRYHFAGSAAADAEVYADFSSRHYFKRHVAQQSQGSEDRTNTTSYLSFLNLGNFTDTFSSLYWIGNENLNLVFFCFRPSFISKTLLFLSSTK